MLRYRDADFDEQLRGAAPNGLDRVVEVAPAANVSTYVRHLNSHAAIASYARDDDEVSIPIQPMMWANALVRFVHIYGVRPSAHQQAVTDLTTMLEAGALRPLPTHHFSLDEIDDAHNAVASHVTGKVLVHVV